MPRIQRRRTVALTVLTLSPVLLGALGPMQNFDARVLAAHNRERNALGAPALRWSSELSRSAAKWATELASTERFEHSPDAPGEEPEGENLWAGTAGHYQPESMVGLWIAEKQNFKTGNFPNNSHTGDVRDVSHYTQVIWAQSGEVGCAVARGKKEDFLVCRYKQAGNLPTERPI